MCGGGQVCFCERKERDFGIIPHGNCLFYIVLEGINTELCKSCENVNRVQTRRNKEGRGGGGGGLAER